MQLTVPRAGSLVGLAIPKTQTRFRSASTGMVTPQMPKFSRRGFAGFLLAPLFRLEGQPSASPPGPGEGAVESSPRTRSRTYRADAVILFLGISIFRRAGVGGGQASLEETGEGASL